MLRLLYKNLNKNSKNHLLIFFFLSFMSSFSEIVTVSAVFPFLSMITNPDKIFSHELVTPVKGFFNIVSLNDFMLFVIFAFIFIIIISGFFRLSLVWFTARLGNIIGADFSLKIYSSTLYQPYLYHVNRNSSELISGIFSKVNMVVSMVIIPLFNTFSSLIMLFVFFIFFIFYNPIIFLSIFGGFFILYFLIILSVRNKIKYNSIKINEEVTSIVKILQEGLGGIRDILIDGTQDLYINIFKKSDKTVRVAQTNISLLGASPRYIVEAFGIIFISLTAFSLTKKQTNGDDIIVFLGVFVMGAFRVMPFLQQMYLSWTSIMGYRSSFFDVISLLKQEIPTYVRKNNKIIEFEKSLVFENVSFKYSNNSPVVLNNINLCINKGDRIGIIGSTGSGKSTLLDILMGLLPPSEGFIYVDGVPLDSSNFRDWQAHISHVPQSIFLSDSTILENVAFGCKKEDIVLENVIKAIRKARLLDFIESLPDKLNTFVGEQGVRLSGGQRQRIGIARALYKNSNVLILDEATSSLDNNTESEIMDSIKELSNDLTVIIVAHRLTTLVNCNKIIEIDNGNIVKLHNYEDII